MHKRTQILILAIIAVFCLLYLRLIHLQVVESGRFTVLAVENAAKLVPDPAPRGVIYDRQGRVMVDNRPIFSLRILPYVLSSKSEEQRRWILDYLSRLLGERIDPKVSATEPIIVKDNIPLDRAIQIEEQKGALEGVLVYSRPVRRYPYEKIGSHLLGHVGEIEAAELERMRGGGYRMGDVVGKDGVEKIYDHYIRGRDGGKRVEVDAFGTPTRILETVDSVPGADMTLTIDLDIQQVAEAALGQQEGAVVVMDAHSGEVLAIASYPNFDPNIFTDSRENWRWKMLERENHPFMNRALAIYPPGSIFKVITLTAALEEGIADPEEIIECNGSYKVHNRIAKCWLEGGHGPITVKEGLVWSCDVVFYELGKRLGADLLEKYCKAYGLGQRSGIDLPQEKMGFVPNSKWKEKKLKEPWYNGDSINYGIGQGFVQVTPLQMAVLYAALATGNIIRPYVVKEIRNGAGEVVYKGEPQIVGKAPVSPENLALIRSLLREVVLRGTGVATRFTGIPAAGKTGTAENPGEPHAWFICYAPFDKPEIVIASFVAHGEHGDRASAYVARDILKWYKLNRVTRDFPPDGPFSQYIVQRGKYNVPYRGNPRSD